MSVALDKGGAISHRIIKSVSDGLKLRLARKKAVCCGIFGYCGDKDASQILSEGVRLLQNRGYDSCGMSTISNSILYTTKFASKGSTSDSVDLLLENAPVLHKGHHSGIAHTRWATHGGKTDENAHPHHDWKNRIALVHNGTIDNFDVLKAELLSQKIPFTSETDTEVIANLIGVELDKGTLFQDAVKAVINRLQGTWGLVIIHKDYPDEFVCARNGSPLIVGATGGQIFVASEPLALAQYTNEYVALNDGDVVHVSRRGGLDHLDDGRDRRKIVKEEELEFEPTPFTHWTVKEIYEQPRSLSRAINFGARLGSEDGCAIKLGGLDLNRERMLAIRNLLITGCGTSLHAGMFGELMMKHLDCFDSVVTVDASEITAASFAKPLQTCGVLALSQSGETRDVVCALDEADRLNVTRFSVVNQVGSLIARMTNCGVYLNAGREVAVASTKAFTSQVAVLSLLSCWFAARRGQSKAKGQAVAQALLRLPLTTAHLLGLDGQCRKLATSLGNARTLFVLGKGLGYPVALEGALKIKEISYIHAEGFPAGSLKHGPFALIDDAENTPVILLILRDSNLPAMINALQQVKARGARPIVITDDPSLVNGATDDVIQIQPNGPLTILGAIVPLQLLAYHLAIQRGINPDKPRGLAKTVTVM